MFYFIDILFLYQIPPSYLPGVSPWLHSLSRPFVSTRCQPLAPLSQSSVPIYQVSAPGSTLSVVRSYLPGVSPWLHFLSRPFLSTRCQPLAPLSQSSVPIYQVSAPGPTLSVVRSYLPGVSPWLHSLSRPFLSTRCQPFLSTRCQPLAPLSQLSIPIYQMSAPGSTLSVVYSYLPGVSPWLHSLSCPPEEARALSYYCDMALSQEFLPMGAQVSLKALLPLAEILATASDRCSKTGPRFTNCPTHICFGAYSSTCIQ